MKKDLNFEQAMQRLEEIIAALDGGSLTLEKNLELFGEGAELIAYCNESLEQAKMKMETLFPTGQEN